jgi:hypothetical protein
MDKYFRVQYAKYDNLILSYPLLPPHGGHIWRSCHLWPRLSGRVPPAAAPPPAPPLRARWPRPQQRSSHVQPATSRTMDRDGGDAASGGGRCTSCFPTKSTTLTPSLARISFAFCSSPLPYAARISSAAAWWQAGAASPYSPRATVARRGVLRPAAVLSSDHAVLRPLPPPTT